MITIRPARSEESAALADLMPGLADFPLPPDRNPDDLWRADAHLLARHLSGDADNVIVLVAADEEDRPLGLAMVSLGKELLSGAPSAHLEALVVGPDARGQGTGRKLLEAAETAASRRGARSMSLHVFRRNERARKLYDAMDYDSELIRCLKWLPAPKAGDEQ